jgi:hypothetical protein
MQRPRSDLVRSLRVRRSEHGSACQVADAVGFGHRVNANITSLANSSSDSCEAAKTT